MKKSLLAWSLAVIVLLNMDVGVSYAGREGKWIDYGRGVLNAESFGSIKLVDSIADRIEVSLEEFFKRLTQKITLTIAVEFSLPTTFTLTVFRGDVSTPAEYKQARQNAEATYVSIKKFLKSSDAYMSLSD